MISSCKNYYINLGSINRASINYKLKRMSSVLTADQLQIKLLN